MMNLETELNKALEEFKSVTSSQLDHMKLSREQTATRNELEQLRKQMYNCLSSFKDAIVTYAQDKTLKG